MEDVNMEGAFFLALMIISVVLGLRLNWSFEKKYSSSAIQAGPCLLQCIAIGIVLWNWPVGDVQPWFWVGIVLVVLTYAFAFVFCKRNAVESGATDSDVIKAIVAQFLLPVGVVVLIFVIIGMSADRRKKKS
jgi:Ca2+/Na+ antiporter